MPLTGHVILIVELELLPFVSQFQDAVEAERGEASRRVTHQPRSRVAKGSSSPPP